jgi:transposase
MNTLYGGIDLHSNNSVVVVSDEEDRVKYQRRLDNDLPTILRALSPFQAELKALAVESTYNWDWLVDGLMEAGYKVHLAHTPGNEPYRGLKYSDDTSDAGRLAHLLRVGLLHEGFIYPKETRCVRDLLRQRSRLVAHRTAHLLSLHGMLCRWTGGTIKGRKLRTLTECDLERLEPNPHRRLAMSSHWKMVEALEVQIAEIEQSVHGHAQLRPEFEPLLTIWGVGQALGVTIMLETGRIDRFKSVGDYASYCRCVPSDRISNGKSKGKGNRKNGNRYLAWAFGEAAMMASRYYEPARRFVQRKAKNGKKSPALAAVANKLCRAAYYVMRDQVEFDPAKLFKS